MYNQENPTNLFVLDTRSYSGSQLFIAHLPCYLLISEKQAQSLTT